MTQPPAGASTSAAANLSPDLPIGTDTDGLPLTPALLLDEAIMRRNVQRMHERLAGHDVIVRPHVKTAKSLPVIAAMTAERGAAPADSAAAARLTVSTLREAGEVVAAGYRDVLYAVGIEPRKLQALGALAADSGSRISVLLDSVAMAEALLASTTNIDAFIELDVDNHRAGVRPDSEELLAIAAALAPAQRGESSQDNAQAPRLRGVMTHAGGAYGCRSRSELVSMAERERSGAVRAAQRLRAAGYNCSEVSVGSTPTATVAETFAGVTEVRVGVYVFNDLVMAGLGVCGLDEIALSVLTTVIGHQPDRNTLLVDAGWMALSSDRSTADQRIDQGLGVVLGAGGMGTAAKPADLVVVAANQEHGLIQRRDAAPIDYSVYPIGSQLRLLPVHACATAAQFAGYHLLRPRQDAADTGPVAATEAVTALALAGYWPRFGGWQL